MGGPIPQSPPDPTAEEILSLIESQMALEGPLLRILHAIQSAYGQVPQMALPLIAEALNITRAEVHGVMSFYHDFREVPAGRHVVKICRAEACQSVGANALAEGAGVTLAAFARSGAFDLYAHPDRILTGASDVA